MFSGMGKRNSKAVLGADDFRKAGVPTVGGGDFCDRLEKDRDFGEQVAKEAGCLAPPTKSFDTVSAAIAYCKRQGDKEMYFKPDDDLGSDATHGGTADSLVRYLTFVRMKYGDSHSNIVQDKVDGTALSTACWWNGGTFIRPYEGTIEHKKLLDGDRGPSTGCQFNAVWMYPNAEPKAAQGVHWDAFTEVFRMNEAPPGLYDINAIARKTDGQLLFLEWTPRCGWDSEATSIHLLKSHLGKYLSELARGEVPTAEWNFSDVAYSVRVCVPPYPMEHVSDLKDKDTCVGMPVHGVESLVGVEFSPYGLAASEDGEQLFVADRMGIVGVAGAVSHKLSAAHGKVMKFIESMEPKNMIYRTDGDKVLGKDAKALRALGYTDIPLGMVQ
jgi:phosphoribosylamine-glycine ligase